MKKTLFITIVAALLIALLLKLLPDESTGWRIAGDVISSNCLSIVKGKGS